MKKLFYTGVGVSLIALNHAHAAIETGKGNINENVTGTASSLDTAVQNIISNVLGFLAVLAVVLLLWGGFNILTAAGDEEKVKKGKTVIIQAGIGLVVIFLATSVVNWLIGLVSTGV